MHDLHGEIARIKVLLAAARSEVKRLEELRALGVEMRAQQTQYFSTRHHGDKKAAIALERKWDRLAAEADPVTGKPTVKFAQGRFFLDDEIRRLGGGEAHAIPRGPWVDRLLTFAIDSLSMPAACPHCAPEIDPKEYRHHDENKLDALIWVRGYLSMALASGQAESPEEAAEQILTGGVKLKAFSLRGDNGST